jgi:cell wall assembly regulator SMI1
MPAEAAAVLGSLPEIIMAKSPRPLTQEFELAGQRLTLTVSDTGVSLKLAGSRKAAREITWDALVCLAARPDAQQTPTDDQVAAAVQALGAGGNAKSKTAATAGKAAGSTSVSALLARLEKWLAKHRKRFLRSMPEGATLDELDALQSALGQPVPDELRALLAWHNGQGEDFAGCFYEQWYLLSTVQIAKVHDELVKGQKGRFRAEGVPFLNDDRDNCVFLDTSQEPPPVREFWQKNKDQPTLAPSLAAWLEDFVNGVEAGEFTEDPERGHFVRGE